MGDPPTAPAPQPQAVEIEVDDRRRVKGEQLADDQPANDRNTERAAQFGAFAEPDRQRQRPEHRSHRRHHDRPEALEAGLIDRLARTQTLAAFGVESEIDHHYRVLLDDPDQQDDADQRHNAELGIGDDQREYRADPS